VLAIYYWKVIMSVRLSVGAFGFKGWHYRIADVTEPFDTFSVTGISPAASNTA
jgi:hypothetical protein